MVFLGVTISARFEGPAIRRGQRVDDPHQIGRIRMKWHTGEDGGARRACGTACTRRKRVEDASGAVGRACGSSSEDERRARRRETATAYESLLSVISGGKLSCES
jgi:hypothetical protein